MSEILEKLKGGDMRSIGKADEVVRAMQTLADFAERDGDIRERVIGQIEHVMKTGSPAIVARGKKLVKKLNF